MAAIELNAKLAQQLDIVREDENLLAKVVKAIDRLIKKQQQTEEYISKEEILAGIDAGLREVKMTKEGKLKPKTARDFLNEL